MAYTCSEIERTCAAGIGAAGCMTVGYDARVWSPVSGSLATVWSTV